MLKAAAAKPSSRRAIMSITMTALFAALIAGGAFIAIPLPFSPVPVVLQNLFILLAGLVLGPVLGTASAALYLFVGALGLPVFAGAVGGIARFAGPTGGFLVGYFFCALTAGLIAGFPRAGIPVPLWRIIAAAVLGLFVVYIPGVFRLYLIYRDWTKSLVNGFLPFLIGDGIKAVIAIAAAPRLRRLTADLFAR